MSELSRLRIFAYVDAEKAHLYRAIMGVFFTAKERFVLHLRPGEVAQELGAVGSTPEEVEPALKQLEEWGNLRASPDSSDVTRVEDFYRERRLYQLSRHGEAAERAVREYERSIEQPGELQTAALADIRDLLAELDALAACDALDAGKVYQTFDQLRRRFEDLTTKAQVFLGGLRRGVELHAGDEESFVFYKERLIGYLERFLQELVVATVSITRAIERVQERGVDRLLDAVARREVVDRIDVDEAMPRALAEWRSRWRGLSRWFLGANGQPSQAEILRAAARSAIPALLTAAAAMNDRRVRRTDRHADWRALARWFAEVPSDEDAHRVYRAAFALSPARHMRINAESLAAMDERMIAPQLRWLDVPTLRLTPRFRSTGRHDRRGAERKIEDKSAARERLAELAEEEARQIEAARRRLCVGRVRLSELGALDAGSFELFLDLLADALSNQPHPRAPVETVSTDGAILIRLEPIGDGSTATIHASTGALTGPNCWIELVDLARPRAARSEAAE